MIVCECAVSGMRIQDAPRAFRKKARAFKTRIQDKIARIQRAFRTNKRAFRTKCMYEKVLFRGGWVDMEGSEHAPPAYFEMT